MFGGNINPSKGRTQDSAHGGAKSGIALKDNLPKGEGNASGNVGDGFHHHEIHGNESGFHSKHTHPDGKEDHGDHASSEEAMDHAHQMFGHEDMGRDDSKEERMEHSEDADEGPDFSAAYSR